MCHKMIFANYSLWSFSWITRQWVQIYVLLKVLAPLFPPLAFMCPVYIENSEVPPQGAKKMFPLNLRQQQCCCPCV